MAKSWRQAARDALVSGSVASLLSSAVLSVCGVIERGSPAGPNNGPSQWIWGRRAARSRRASLRYTLVGMLIHHSMSLAWATVHERLFGARATAKPVTRRLVEGATTAALASLVDYRLTPVRFRPGFEQQLCRSSLFAVYASFGLGLIVPSLLRRARRAPLPAL